MNRNNFLPHVALAIVVILIAAFAGQVRKWQNQWHSRSELRRIEIAKTSLERVEKRSTNLQTESVGKEAEVLVRFRAGTSPERIQSIVLRLNDQVEDQIEAVSGLDVIEDEDGLDAERVAAEYRGLPEVEYAEPAYEIKIDSFFNPVLPNDERFAEQWALANTGQNGGKAGADISATFAWATTKGSDKVVVAVLDSGVDYTHSDLEHNIWKRPENIKAYDDRDLGEIDDEYGFSAIDENRDPMDQNGHGTHCAGIIGAEGGNNEGITGVNWNVKIMPLKFMDASGSGTTADAIAAINYVIDRKQAGVNVRVISASWGSTQRSRALEDVIRKAGEAGILFVAASGNSSVDTDRSPHYPSSYNLPNVISVAALDRNDALASFSNFGAKSVHIAAPGKDILSTWLDNGFRYASGTSMATPVVSGVAALVLAKEPNLSVEQLKQRVLHAVDPLPGLKGKVVTGGRINSAKAVGAD